MLLQVVAVEALRLAPRVHVVVEPQRQRVVEQRGARAFLHVLTPGPDRILGRLDGADAVRHHPFERRRSGGGIINARQRLEGGVCAAAEINVVSSTSSNNGIAGVRSEGAASIIRLTDTTVSDNATGLVSVGGGQIVSFGNNRNAGNTTAGAPTSTVSQF